MLRSILSVFIAWLLLCSSGVYAAATAPRESDSSNVQSSDPMAERARACAACHGAEGRAAADGYYPRLAGKPAGYLYHQLRNFAEGRRHYTLMTGLLDNLSDDYLHALANYFSSLDLPYAAPPAAKADARVLARGEELVRRGDKALELPACERCHGKSLTGVAPDIPGLLGLPADYINAQLGGWRTGQRSTPQPDCMARIARHLQLSDISAVARWLASQPVPDAKTRALSQAAAVDQKISNVQSLKEYHCASAP